jgi:hypothetical protein
MTMILKTKSIVMRRIEIVLVCSLILMSGCTGALKVMKGVTKPKVETRKSTTRYLGESYKGKIEGIFILKDSASFYKWIAQINGLPTALFFDSRGFELVYADSSYCSGKAEEFASSFSPGMQLETSPDITLQMLNEAVAPVAGDSRIRSDSADCVLIVCWAKWIGKINNNVWEVAQALEKNSWVCSKIYFINFDFQEEWKMHTLPEIRY